MPVLFGMNVRNDYTPMNITEILDKVGFHVLYDDETNTWEIIDSFDEDGYRVTGIKPESKQHQMLIAAEFVEDVIYRGNKK